MGLKMVSAKGVASTTVEHKTKGKTISEQQKQEDVLPAQLFEGQPCTVGVDVSLTINLGNFNSAKVGCSITLPCLHSEIDEVFVFARDWADAKVTSMAEEAQAASVE